MNDQAQQIEDYLRAKGYDGWQVPAEARKTAMKVAAITAQKRVWEKEAWLDHGHLHT